ncbi:MAG: flavohemoprotein, partial [Sutterella wadsworthensis]
MAAAGDAPAGLMSNHLHKCLKAGDTIDVSAPAGEFHLAEGTNPVFLAGAGIGVTPIFAMLESIARNTPERQVTFVQVARTASELVFVNEVREAAGKLKNAKLLAFVTQPAEADTTIKCPCV